MTDKTSKQTSFGSVRAVYESVNQRMEQLRNREKQRKQTWCKNFLELLLQYYACYINSLALFHLNGTPVETPLFESLIQCLKVPIYGNRIETAHSSILPDRLIYDVLTSIDLLQSLFNGSILSADEAGPRIYLLEVTYEADYEKAINKAESLGICKNRLWNLVSGCRRGWFDLPALLAMIDESVERAELFRHTDDFDLRAQAAVGALGGLSGEHGHQDCTPDLCHFSSMDSTRVAQRHKCSQSKRQSCSLIQFSAMSGNTINDVVWTYRIDSTMLNHRTVPYRPSCTEYVAVSHVWSDGTGAGVHGDGQMNECLFRFFCDIAKILQCGGIWWDAISIPSEPKLRKEAIRRMHFHFRSAKYTVVHDEYLMKFPWKDDGTPCLALVLSPWFTRGWTALELTMSKSVKILFKNPDDDRMPVIKDLNQDVLANRLTASLGHLVASLIVRKVWQVGNIGREERNLWELTDILKTRSTSWPRDRVVIAALLSGINPATETTNMQAFVMNQIITSYRFINASVLIHGSSTIEEHGRLSWCPTDLFSRSSAILLDDIKFWHHLKLEISLDAALDGMFLARPLNSMNLKVLEPFSTHIALHRKLRSAFTKSKEHLIITCSQNQRICLVVRAISIENIPRRAIECEPVGVVLCNLSRSELVLDRKSDPAVMKGWLSSVVIRIGADAATPNKGSSAEDLLRSYYQDKGPVDPTERLYNPFTTSVYAVSGKRIVNNIIDAYVAESSNPDYSASHRNYSKRADGTAVPYVRARNYVAEDGPSGYSPMDVLERLEGLETFKDGGVQMATRPSEFDSICLRNW
ncbi:MAG: hypothetical protein Q9160_004070 [Pyrenula sp. 1 TL-2023]